MAIIELDLDVTILRTDGTGVIVGHIDAADRHADVVDDGTEFLRRNDLPDCLFDIGKLTCGFLDASSYLSSGVHKNLACIDRWKEVATQKRR